MGKKIWTAFIAGCLLVGAGFVTSLISSPGTAVALEERDTDDSGPFPRVLGFLEEVLNGLVGDGTLTQEQADAVAQAAEDKAGELRDEREAERNLLRSFLEDGVITEDEASQLPDDHPLLSERFDDAWEDGELTREEIGPHHRDRPFKRGFRLGTLLDDGGIDQEEYDSLMDSLDENHPLRQLDVTEYLEDDGLITREELAEIHQDLHGSYPGEGA
ncbi:MAG: hypothetical protein PVF87_03035 [Acidimicrobiia bacterium]